MKLYVGRTALVALCALAASVAPLASCATGGDGVNGAAFGTDPDSGGQGTKVDSSTSALVGDSATASDAPGSVLPDSSLGSDDATAPPDDAGQVADAPLTLDAADATPFDSAPPVDAADAAPPPPVIPTVGLVGEWLCSSNVNDTSGNANNGQQTNVAYVLDRHNVSSAACSFDGSTSVIAVPTSASLGVTTAWSLSAWVHPAAFATLAGIVSKYHSNGANGLVVRLSYNSPYSGIDVDEATNSSGVNAGTLLAASWSHVAVTVNGTEVSCYIDDSLVYSRTAGYTTATNTDSFDIGLDYTNRYFTGAIDDVRLYNRVLTDGEIQTLYQE